MLGNRFGCDVEATPPGTVVIAWDPRAATWFALSYLVIVGSVLVFVLYLIVLRRWNASRAAYVFVLIPVVTVFLSAWLDNEPIGIGLVFGGLVVLAGVYFGALRPAQHPTAATAADRTG